VQLVRSSKTLGKAEGGAVRTSPDVGEMISCSRVLSRSNEVGQLYMNDEWCVGSGRGLVCEVMATTNEPRRFGQVEERPDPGGDNITFVIALSKRPVCH
jgi:hypothetical protein